MPRHLQPLPAAVELPLTAPLPCRRAPLQVLVKGGDKLEFDEPNPFKGEEDEEVASKAYRYRRWTLNKEDDVDIIVRCELDGAITNKVGSGRGPGTGRVLASCCNLVLSAGGCLWGLAGGVGCCQLRCGLVVPAAVMACMCRHWAAGLQAVGTHCDGCTWTRPKS